MLKRLPFDLGYYLPGIFARGDSSTRYGDVSLSSTAYVIERNGDCGIVDAGVGTHGFRVLVRHLRKHRLTPRWILLTHDHYDHTGNAAHLKEEFGTSVLMHSADRPLAEQPLRVFDEQWMSRRWGGTLRQAFADMNRSPDQYLAYQRELAENQYYPVSVDSTLEDGDVLELGDMQLQIIHTPGHSPGSLSVYVPVCGALFAGDLPMWLGPARPYPLGNYADWLRSMARLSALEVTLLAWGHAEPTAGGGRCQRFLRATRCRVRRMERETARLLGRRECTTGEILDHFTEREDAFLRRLREDSLHAILHTMREESAASRVCHSGRTRWRAS